MPVEPKLAPQSERIVLRRHHDLIETDRDFPAVGGAGVEHVTLGSRLQVVALGAEILVLLLERGAAGRKVRHDRFSFGPRHAVVFQAALFETDILELIVDSPDLAAFDAIDLRMQLVGARDSRLEFGPEPFGLGNRLAVLLDPQRVAVEVPPLTALDHHRVFGVAPFAQRGL